MILAEKGQSLREDDGKLLHKDTRILGPVMRSDQRLSYPCCGDSKDMSRLPVLCLIFWPEGLRDLTEAELERC
jgi:hypothetical protein